MGESNEAWGDQAEHDDDLAEEWDRYDRLPDAGVNDALDAFCARKRIDIPSLVRLGTRIVPERPTVLVFSYPGGLKYRDMETDKRHSYPGSEWQRMNVLRAGAQHSDTVIIAEGETDACRLSILYPGVDVASLPAGAKRWTDRFTAQVEGYAQVLVGTDPDEAGDEGYAKIRAAVPQAQRFAPPAGDWCEHVGDTPALPEPPPPAASLVVFGEQLFELDMPEVSSWFADALLPIGGQLVLHAAMKSFKSFIGLDLMAALAQGTPWACFEPLEEPARVCVLQYEIPPDYYRKRIALLRQHATDQAAFDANFGTWTPLSRPRLRADSPKSVDELRKGLAEAEIQVVFLDPIRRAAGGIDLDKEQDARKLLTVFERLQDDGITVVANHHDNKSAARAGGGDPLGMTGSGGWAGDADSLVSLALPKGGKLEDPRRNIHFLVRNGPAIAPRGFTMREDGRITYSIDPHLEGDDPSDDGAPAI